MTNSTSSEQGCLLANRCQETVYNQILPSQRTSILVCCIPVPMCNIDIKHSKHPNFDCCIPVHITIRESMPSPFHRRKMLGRETWCKVPFIPCRHARADSQWIGFRGFDSNLSLEPTEATPSVWCSVDDPLEH